MRKIFVLFLCVVMLLSASAECFAYTVTPFAANVTQWGDIFYFKSLKTDQSILSAADKVSVKPYASQSTKSAQYRNKYPLMDAGKYPKGYTTTSEYWNMNNDAGFMAFRDKYFGEYYNYLSWCAEENNQEHKVLMKSKSSGSYTIIGGQYSTWGEGENRYRVYLVSPEIEKASQNEKIVDHIVGDLTLPGKLPVDANCDKYTYSVVAGAEKDEIDSDLLMQAFFYSKMGAFNNLSSSNSLRDYVDNGNGYAQGPYSDYLFAKCFYETLNAVYPDLNETFTDLDKKYFSCTQARYKKEGFWGEELPFYGFPNELILLGLTDYAIVDGVYTPQFWYAYGDENSYTDRNGYVNFSDYSYIGYPAYKDAKDLVVYNLYKGRFHVCHAPDGWHPTSTWDYTNY